VGRLFGVCHRYYRRSLRFHRRVSHRAYARAARSCRAPPGEPVRRAFHSPARRHRRTAENGVVKIAVIGGASARTPLLVNGLAHSNLPIDEIALLHPDEDRLRVIASVAGTFAPCVRTGDDARRCISGATFGIPSIRAGGIAARVRDEAIAIEHGTVGQESVGPAGFAMAMRNIPPAIEYARLVAREAPRAWIVNFTNPVGIITQA